MHALKLANFVLFLSTLSLRRATQVGQKRLRQKLAISIHALLAESDRPDSQKYINSRTFLSTLSLRRATVHFDNFNLHCVISIHALLAESDCLWGLMGGSSYISIHALLAESDPDVIRHAVNLQPISIHALLAESDSKTLQNWRKPHISIHALLAESDCFNSVSCQHLS